MKKKIINVLLSAAVITTMMFSVTACGSKADDAQNTAADAPVETQAAADANANAAEAKTADTPVETQAAADTDANAADEAKTADADEQKDDAADGVMSLEEWIESDDCVEFLEMMNEDMDDEGISVFFEADGDVITFVWKYDEEYGVLADLDDDNKEMLDEFMGSMVDSVADIIEELRDEIIEQTGNENVVLTLEFRDIDDLVIYSQDF
ncbi:MAG: DUF4854 domain-containing protein [Lachnospiraceae bacterium]|nr:DUF4854 domain-containing protein [Lachnospiraceae bacterium]